MHFGIPLSRLITSKMFFLLISRLFNSNVLLEVVLKSNNILTTVMFAFVKNYVDIFMHCGSEILTEK